MYQMWSSTKPCGIGGSKTSAVLAGVGDAAPPPGAGVAALPPGADVSPMTTGEALGVAVVTVPPPPPPPLLPPLLVGGVGVAGGVVADAVGDGSGVSVGVGS
jgi:hypothetical protein